MPASSWPALVGRAVEEAVAELKAAHPHLTVLALPDNSFMTMDYREDRVRVIHDAAGKVSQVPRTG